MTSVRPKSMSLKYITDSVNETMVNFICRDTTTKIKQFLNDKAVNENVYFKFDGGVSEIVNKKTEIDQVLSSLRDFIKQEKEHLISAFALSLLESLNVYYSSFVGNGSWIKLLIFGHFRQIDADFYELKSILKEISDKEDPLTKFLRENPCFCTSPQVRTWTEEMAMRFKPIKYVCGLAFTPVKYICSSISQIFWQGTLETEVKYQASIRAKRCSYILDWLAADLES